MIGFVTIRMKGVNAVLLVSEVQKVHFKDHIYFCHVFIRNV